MTTQLDRIEAMLTALCAHLGLRVNGAAFAQSGPQATAAHVASGDGEIASDDDLASPHGDPEIRRDPKRWEGESYAGRRFSDASPEWLECQASFLEWAAGQAEQKSEMTSGGKPRAPYLRKDAARARGWRARKLGAGAGAQHTTRQARPNNPIGTSDAFEGDPDMPF